jgi:hypothetical protein
MLRWKCGGNLPLAGDNSRRSVDGQRILKEQPENPCAAAAHGRRKLSPLKNRRRSGATPVTPGNRETGASGGCPTAVGGPRGRGAEQSAPHDRNASQGPSISYMEGPWLIVPAAPAGSRERHAGKSDPSTRCHRPGPAVHRVPPASSGPGSRGRSAGHSDGAARAAGVLAAPVAGAVLSRAGGEARRRPRRRSAPAPRRRRGGTGGPGGPLR